MQGKLLDVKKARSQLRQAQKNDIRNLSHALACVCALMNLVELGARNKRVARENRGSAAPALPGPTLVRRRTSARADSPRAAAPRASSMPRRQGRLRISSDQLRIRNILQGSLHKEARRMRVPLGTSTARRCVIAGSSGDCWVISWCDDEVRDLSRRRSPAIRPRGAPSCSRAQH
jgi:hypothetical protein